MNTICHLNLTTPSTICSSPVSTNPFLSLSLFLCLSQFFCISSSCLPLYSHTLISYTQAHGCGCNILWFYLRWVERFPSWDFKWSWIIKRSQRLLIFLPSLSLPEICKDFHAYRCCAFFSFYSIITYPWLMSLIMSSFHFHPPHSSFIIWLGRWKIVQLQPVLHICLVPQLLTSFSSHPDLLLLVSSFSICLNILSGVRRWPYSRLGHVCSECPCSLALAPDQPCFHPRYRLPSTHPSRTEIQTHIPDHISPPPHSLLSSFSPLLPSVARSTFFSLIKLITHSHTHWSQGCNDQQTHE